MIYRKRGSVVRWENGTLVRVAERGLAIEENGLFTCTPEATGEIPDVDIRNVEEAVREIRSICGDLIVERLIVTEGSAEHECDGRTWQEAARRVHLSLVRERMRVLIDLATFDAEEVARIASVLARADMTERQPPARLRFAPGVTAALLPWLVGIAPPNVRLFQSAGGVDGHGLPVVEAVSGWPNWYRPTYRARPIRTPLNLRLECDVETIDGDRPIAVALLEPARGLTLHVLVDDGPSVFPARVRVTRIDAVRPERTWYPYAAGSFGAEMML